MIYMGELKDENGEIGVGEAWAMGFVDHVAHSVKRQAVDCHKVLPLLPLLPLVS